MDKVIKVMKQRKCQYQNDQFILWMREQSKNVVIEATEAINDITIITAYFYLAFTDLNRRAFYYPNPTDKYMKAINLHTEEDRTHYKMFLQDFKKMGFDKKYNSVDLLSILWSDQGSASRDLAFDLHEIAIKYQHPGMRYALIESIEKVGKIFLTAIVDITKKLPNSKDFEFFGEKHLQLEEGHLMNIDGIDEHELFGNMDLTSEQVEQAIATVNATWDAFEKWNAEIMTALKVYPLFLQGISHEN